MKYIFFAPYKQLSLLAEQVCRELGLKDWVIEYGYMGDCVKAAKNYARQGAQVVVARGITADILDKNLNIPIVRLTTTPYDILPLVSQIQEKRQKIAVVGFPLTVYGIETMDSVFGHEFIEFPISSLEEIPEIIEKIKGLGITYVFGGSATFSQAQKAGLTGYLLETGKNTVAFAMKQAEEIVAAKSELTEKGLVAKYHFNHIVTQSHCMKDVIIQAEKFAAVDSTILITGETGTGKELFAQSIHNAGKRSSGPFMAVNCASIPEALLESELFGYESGAFTGARKNGKKGYFELASKGTLFLDEIGEIPCSLQSALLRVLQEHSIIRVGGDRIIPVNARIICATHQDLKKACEENRFRQDLYHRLNILRLNIPPLTQRPEDIPILVQFLLQKTASRLGILPAVPDREIIKMLENCNFSGNVRELEAMMERLNVLKSGQTVSAPEFTQIFSDKLFSDAGKTCRLMADEMLHQKQPKEDTLILPLAEAEKQYILSVMEACGGNKALMCRYLKISKSTLWRKLKQYRLNENL